jgi:hypothetical protein
MQNDIAVDKIADTDFRADEIIINSITGEPITDPVVRNLITKPRMPKGINWEKINTSPIAFSRGIDGAADCVGTQPSSRKLFTRPNYLGSSLILSGEARQPRRDPSDEEKRAAWPLQDEYNADRLGKDGVENSKLWDTAMWIDRLYGLATMPPIATRPLSLIMTNDDIHPSDIEDFGEESVIPVLAFEMLEILEQVEALDDVEKQMLLPRKSDRQRPVFDSRLLDGECRADADKTIRILMAGMRSVWSPVKLAIIDNVEMWRLGTTQGVGRQMAATAGRQRVIEGLRLAVSIRKDMVRSELTGNTDILPLTRAASEIHGFGERECVTEFIQIKRLPANDNSRAKIAA